MNKNIAIVTGASSGLGTAFVKELVVNYSFLDEIWIIARSKDKLEKLSALKKDVIKPISLDLSKSESFDKLKSMLAESNPNISILVCNAGMGSTGQFEKMGLNDQQNVIDLNVKAYLSINHICLPYMKEKSYIVETCSIAAFVPNINMTVYSATKAFVLSFSRSLRGELKSRKINVLALCPGIMDTNLSLVKDNKGNKTILNKLPKLKVEKVAKKSLIMARKGKDVYTPSFFYKFFRVLSKILPHKCLMNVTKV